MEPEASGTDQRVGEIDTALCRATLYGALALGFRPPEEKTIARLCSEEGSAALTEAATPLDATGRLAATARRLTMGRKNIAHLSSSYWRLFGHTARGVAPPYETEYGSEALFQQPQELGDLLGFYRAVGLTLNVGEHERADHISCECEFLSFLALKEAYALEHRDDSMLEETRKAARLFLRDHLGRFVPAFAKKLTRIGYPHPRPLPAGEGWGEGEGNAEAFHDDSQSFYGALGNLLLTFVNQECARFGVPMGPAGQELRPATDDGVPMACGSGAECAAMPGAGTPEEMEE